MKQETLSERKMEVIRSALYELSGRDMARLREELKGWAKHHRLSGIELEGLIVQLEVTEGRPGPDIASGADDLDWDG